MLVYFEQSVFVAFKLTQDLCSAAIDIIGIFQSLRKLMATRESMKQWIVEYLNSSGGRGSPRDVSKYVWEKYESELKSSGDLLYTWQYDIRWAAQKLRNEGVLKSVNGRRDLPWELS